MGVNSITLVGRAGRDPEVRYFESGSMVANLTMAVNRRSNGDEPDWFSVPSLKDWVMLLVTEPEPICWLGELVIDDAITSANCARLFLKPPVETLATLFEMTDMSV